MVFKSFKYCRLPAGVLRVMILQAEGLEDADFIGKSDPYVKLKVGSQMEITRTVNNDLNPVWANTKKASDFAFDFLIHDRFGGKFSKYKLK